MHCRGTGYLPGRQIATAHEELIDAAIDRIERFNGALNAVVTTCFEEAREAAQHMAPGSPLQSVVLSDFV